MSDRQFYRYAAGTHTFSAANFLSASTGGAKSALFRVRGAGAGGNAPVGSGDGRAAGAGSGAGSYFEKVIILERDVTLVVGTGGIAATDGVDSSISFGSTYDPGIITITAGAGSKTFPGGGLVTNSGSDITETGALPGGFDNVLTSTPDFSTSGGDAGDYNSILDGSISTGYASGGGGVAGRSSLSRKGVIDLDNFLTGGPGGKSYMAGTFGRGGNGGKPGQNGKDGLWPGGGGGGGGTRPASSTDLSDAQIALFVDRGFDPAHWSDIILDTVGGLGADGVIEVITPAPVDGSDCCCDLGVLPLCPDTSGPEPWPAFRHCLRLHLHDDGYYYTGGQVRIDYAGYASIDCDTGDPITLSDSVIAEGLRENTFLTCGFEWEFDFTICGEPAYVYLQLVVANGDGGPFSGGGGSADNVNAQINGDLIVLDHTPFTSQQDFLDRFCAGETIHFVQGDLTIDVTFIP